MHFGFDDDFNKNSAGTLFMILFSCLLSLVLRVSLVSLHLTEETLIIQLTDYIH